MPLVGYLNNGEQDDFSLTFGARMPSGQSASGTAWGWYVPAGVSALASALSGNSAINVRLYSTAPGYIYAISGYIHTTNGRRLIETFELHVG